MHLIRRKRTARTGSGRFVRLLYADDRGVALIEFAIALPVMLVLAVYGAEIARLAITNMQVSQIALTLADNASRMGQTDNSAIRPSISEADVDSVMFGAMEQGEAIGFEEDGRVILSSLEVDPDTGDQFIHWQRCRGELDVDSDYGPETPDGSVGDGLPGMGQAELIKATSDKSTVMFVEVEYRYEPMFDVFFTGNRTIRQEAAFVIRDDRNLAPGVPGETGC